MPDRVEFDIGFKIDDIDSRLKKIEDEIKAVGSSTDQQTNRMRKAFSNTTSEADRLNGVLKSIGGYVMAYLTVNTAFGLAQGIIATRSEFEKFSAVLTTAYGNTEKADRAMSMLKETAKETPFQLAELAQAFILLKNRGLEPSKDSLIKAGDFASSTG